MFMLPQSSLPRQTPLHFKSAAKHRPSFRTRREILRQNYRYKSFKLRALLSSSAVFRYFDATGILAEKFQQLHCSSLPLLYSSCALNIGTDCRIPYRLLIFGESNMHAGSRHAYQQHALSNLRLPDRNTVSIAVMISNIYEIIFLFISTFSPQSRSSR